MVATINFGTKQQKQDMSRFLVEKDALLAWYGSDGEPIFQCPSCDFLPIPKGANYCSCCGQKINTEFKLAAFAQNVKKGGIDNEVRKIRIA